MIAGHLDTETGPDVFYRLNDARKGDRILVKLDDGKKIALRVRRVAVFPRKHFPAAEVYAGPRKSPQLRLITCDGRFDRTRNEYESNVVVFARLLRP